MSQSQQPEPPAVSATLVQHRDSTPRLVIRVFAVLFLCLAVLAQNTVNADMAALPPLLFTLTGALVICLL